MRRLILAVAGVALCAGPALAADDTQDVLYLGAGKPAVVRLHVDAGGKPLRARWDAFMGRLFVYLDVNKSRGLDRIEARRAPTPAQLSQYFQGNVITPGGGRPGMSLGPPFEKLDTNRDGKVTLEELKAYYTANGVGPLLVNAGAVGPASPVGRGLESDRLFQLLDTDKDGKLSRAELEAAESLLRFDDNDDEIVSAAELSLGQPNRFGVPPAPVMMPGPRGGGQLASLILLPQEEGARRRTECLKMARVLIGQLETKPKKDGTLTLKETPFTEEVFKGIDRNGDGKISALELTRMMSARPVGEFRVRMGGAATAARPGKSKKPETLALKLGGTRLTVATGAARFDYGESGLEDFVMSYFRVADKDKRGFITRAQLTGEGRFVLSNVFEQADRDRNGRLTAAEVREYVRMVDSARGAQLVLSLNEEGQGLFQALDANRDGFLSVRELRTAWARLADVDADKDGAISPEEFPRQATLLVGGRGVGRGFAPVNRAPPPPDRGPIWFRKMDRNGDGDVSRSEWLGAPEDFDRIDADKDGLISLEEAEAHDAAKRK